MSDTVNEATRSKIMGRIRGKDTSPEIRVRRRLFAMGFRYRLHVASLPGKPDIILPKWRAVILVHGCFWHWHGCRRSRMPASNTEYWEAKIGRNQARDQVTVDALLSLRWRVLIVWECAVTARMVSPSCQLVADWVRSDTETSLACIEPKQVLEKGDVHPILRQIATKCR